MQAYIAAMPGWKRDVGRGLDALIVRIVPNVRKAVRWNWSRRSDVDMRVGERLTRLGALAESRYQALLANPALLGLS